MPLAKPSSILLTPDADAPEGHMYAVRVLGWGAAARTLGEWAGELFPGGSMEVSAEVAWPGGTTLTVRFALPTAHAGGCSLEALVRRTLAGLAGDNAATPPPCFPRPRGAAPHPGESHAQAD